MLRILSNYRHGLYIAPPAFSQSPSTPVPNAVNVCVFSKIGAILGPSKTRVVENHSVFSELGQIDMNYFDMEEKALWKSDGPCTLQGAWQRGKPSN